MAEEKIVYNLQIKADTKGLDEINKSTEVAGENLKEVSTDTNEASESLDNLGTTSTKAATESKGAFRSMGTGIKTLFKTFLANPVGLIITAIATALTGLYKAFTRSTKGQDGLAKGMGYLKGVVAIITTSFNKFAEVVIDAFEKPKETWESFTSSLKSGYDFIKNQFVDRITAQFDLMGGQLNTIFGKMKLSWNEMFDDTEGIINAKKQIKEGEISILEGLKKIHDANIDAKDAYDKVTDAVGAMVDEFSNIFDIALEIERIQLSNERFAASLTVTNAELEKQKSILEAIADDSTRNLAERKVAAEEAIQLNDKLLQNKLKLAANEENTLRRISQLNKDYSVETTQALAESTAARIEAEGAIELAVIEGEKRIKEIQSDAFEIALDAEVDFTEKKRAELLKRAADEALPYTERAKAISAAEKLTEDSYDRQIKMFNELTDNKLDKNKIAELSDANVVNEYLEGLGLSEVLTNRFLNDVLREQLTVNEEIKDSNEDVEEHRIKLIEETEAEVWANKFKIGKISADEYYSELLRIEIESLEASEKYALLSEQEKLEAIEAMRIEFRENTAAEQSEWEQMNVADQADFAIGSAQALNNNLADLNDIARDTELIKIDNQYSEIERMLDVHYNSERKALDSKLKQGLISERNYNRAVLKLDKDLADDQGDISDKRTEEENKVLKKAFKKAKMFEIASIQMNAASGTIAAWATAMELPYPANLVAGAAMTAAIAATSWAQTAKVNATEFKAAGGGILQGRLHAAGGINIGDVEAEDGEFIINRASTRAYAPLLNSINSAGNTNGDSNNVMPLIDYDMMAAALQSKKVYVVSHDISEQQSEDVKIKDRTEF